MCPCACVRPRRSEEASLDFEGEEEALKGLDTAMT